MMSFVSRGASLLLVVALVGCSSIIPESKKVEYKTAGKAPSLEVPPDLVAPARDDRFAVPDIGGKGGATFSAYQAERSPEGRAARGSDVLPNVDKTRIERSGNQRWLVVAGTPDKVWGTVKEFWQENGLLVKVEMPEAGVMETDWAENRAKLPLDFIRNTLGKVLDSLYSTGERDKFRTRLEPGAEEGTTEIYISHRGMVETLVGKSTDYQTKWEPRPADPELEAEFLRRLMIRFGSAEKRATAALAAAQERQVERAKIVRAADGTNQLEMQERFDRAWRRVGLALDRVGFTVEDRDRSKGLYFVRYVDPEADASSKKDDGWLSKLNPFKGSDKAELSKMQYRILVADAGGTAKVQVLSREGGLDASDTAKKILGLLHEQLR